MLTEKQLREIDEHYLKFTIFGRTFRWFNTSPLHIYNHVQRVKNTVDLADVGGNEVAVKCPYCKRNEPCQGSYPEGCFHPDSKGID